MARSTFGTLTLAARPPGSCCSGSQGSTNTPPSTVSAPTGGSPSLAATSARRSACTSCRLRTWFRRLSRGWRAGGRRRSAARICTRRPVRRHHSAYAPPREGLFAGPTPPYARGTGAGPGGARAALQEPGRGRDRRKVCAAGRASGRPRVESWRFGSRGACPGSLPGRLALFHGLTLPLDKKASRVYHVVIVVPPR
jgi:hypothetical protein